ncbi:hypothetical protein [Bacillus arachidis]|uniref:Bacteriocin-associated integral membrane (Putative immunity) protein n=1 Tax=Bacillus arachidis TaxID=2819290 RepID=A0ABS3NXF7_9BACI|nr:hypothetical protein [Bacillus arachidis]MBO1625260.1 hypothetical protein [Bacillus arachidis]
MKKLLFIFLIGQLFLLSYIFNKSVYDIYELNNLGDSSLDGYIVEDVSGHKLNELYEKMNSTCLSNNTCQLQLVKTPVSKHNEFIYDIYHSQEKDINKPKSISPDTVLNYHPLTKEDFVDSNGVFYTNLSLDRLNDLSKTIGITINPYHNDIAYSQIVTYNVLNFVILFILTQLVLVIYTFTRIKVNAIKKMLGYSKFKMVQASLKDFIVMESVILVITLGVHFLYYVFVGNVVSRYFYLLLVFLVLVIAINVVMLLFTQISLRFIDINLMIKNKVYSNRLNYILYVIKILLILSITVSVSSFISNYREYKAKSRDLERYTKLEGYFTSNGFNSNEDEKARKNPKIIAEYGDAVQKMYRHFDEQEKLYVSDAYILELLKPTYLEMNGLTKEDLYTSIKDNYIVVNERYINDFMKIKNETGAKITNFHVTKPTILVPAKYKSEESKIKKMYIEQYNQLLNYNENFGIPKSDSKNIDNVEVIYIANNQEHELLGKNMSEDDSDMKLKDTIIMIDQGNFGSLYYYDQLSSGNVYFHLNQRDEFNQILVKHHLNKLVNVGTLLTPYMDKVHFVEFIMYNSLVFTSLFLFTLIFVICISNYVDIISNSKRYAIQYMYGYSIMKTFKLHLIVYAMLLSMIVMNIFIEFNVPFYICILVIDFIVLLYLYKKIIKNDIHKIVKGG